MTQHARWRESFNPPTNRLNPFKKLCWMNMNMDWKRNGRTSPLYNFIWKNIILKHVPICQSSSLSFHSFGCILYAILHELVVAKSNTIWKWRLFRRRTRLSIQILIYIFLYLFVRKRWILFIVITAKLYICITILNHTLFNSLKSWMRNKRIWKVFKHIRTSDLHTSRHVAPTYFYVHLLLLFLYLE